MKWSRIKPWYWLVSVSSTASHAFTFSTSSTASSSNGLIASRARYSSSRTTRCFATTSSTIIEDNTDSIKWGKEHWQLHWQAIEEMRAKTTAAVDTMGADALASYDATSNSIQYSTNDDGKVSFHRRDTAEYRFQTLIATMLSPQTKDQQTSQAFYNLQQLLLPHSMLPSNLRTLTTLQIEEAIKMVSFYKIKAKNLLAVSVLCDEQHSNDIPTKIEDLLDFPGVGPKVGYLTFSIAWDQHLGICVDTHVHRISNRLGWVHTWHKKSNGPEHTRKALQTWLPSQYWCDVNFLLVGFGQTICSAKVPKCTQCNLQHACKFYQDPTYMRD